MISKLMNPDVIEFIQENLNKDPSVIALKADKYTNLPIREIATQIASRQKGKKKIPDWFNNQRLIFPPKENLEQASSQDTAEFKASLYQGATFLDLTGGSGVDTYYFSRKFEKSLYVEPNLDLCEIARHNFSELQSAITIHPSSAEEFIQNTNDFFDLIYIDPSRRNESKQRVINLEDYQPNVQSILPELLNKSKNVLIKVSPMVDIKRTIEQLRHVSKVICLAVRNEMKEILFELDKNTLKEPVVISINITATASEIFEGTFVEERNAESISSKPKNYIYEPNSAIRKAGFFKLIGSRFDLHKLGINTHLYTSDELRGEFPGRKLKLIHIIKPDKKLIRQHVSDGIINVISKNFPLNSNELKKKFRLKDGGEDFLIFCSVDGLGNVCLKCANVV